MADTSDYEVKVDLKLVTTEARKEAEKVKPPLDKIDNELDKIRAKGILAMSTVGSALSRMGGTCSRVADSMFRLAQRTAMVGAGITIAGIYAVGRGLQSFSRYSIEANSSVENLTLSLGTLLAQTERITFSEARQGAEDLFHQMQAMAIESPGTTMELADVFQSAVGPMRNAGIGMQNILNMSRDTLSVASALRIDLPQVSRDMGQMLTGAAGQDVRLFRTLRAMGVITETTDQWNAMARRAPEEAANRLVAIMAQLGGPAAESFGRTWAGATSTFSDLVQNFTRVLTGPTFAIVRDALSATNQYLLRYRSNIERVLTGIGERIGEITGTAIGRVRSVASYIINNYRTLITQGLEMVNTLRGIVPQLVEGAQRFLMIAAALKVAGGAMSAMGAVLSGVSGLASLATALGVGGAGAATAAAGTTASGAAVAATGGGGILAAIGAALAPLVPLIAPVAAVLAAIAAAGVAVYAAFQVAGDYISNMFAPIWRDIVAVGRNVWAALRSGWETVHNVFGFIGSFIMGNIAGVFRILAGVARLLTALWRAFAAIFRVATGDLNSGIDGVTRWFVQLMTTVQRVADAFVWLAEKIEQFSRWLERNFSFAEGTPGLTRGGWTPEQRARMEREARTARDNAMFAGLQPRAVTVLTAPTMGTPRERATTNIDMRNSRIEVRQEFREADPDRVWIRMVEGLASEAIHTTTSPLVSAFSRG